MSDKSYMKWLPATALSTLGRLEFLAHGTVDGFVSGKHKSARKGASVEFAEHRQYTPGDDLRNLDWKLVARRQRLYVREYVDETNLRASVVLDASGSMAYGGDRAIAALSKLDYAKYVAASLSYLLINQQDAVGFVSFDDKVRDYLPSKSQPAHLRVILERLDELAPGHDTDIAGVLHEVAERVPRRSVVFVISDFYSDPEALLKAIHHLRFRNNEVIALQISDPDETDFPFNGLKRFEDLENSLELDVDTRALRAEYRERYERHLADLKRGCGDMRVTWEQLTTDVPFEQAVADVIVRYRMRGGGR